MGCDPLPCSYGTLPKAEILEVFPEQTFNHLTTGSVVSVWLRGAPITGTLIGHENGGPVSTLSLQMQWEKCNQSHRLQMEQQRQTTTPLKLPLTAIM